MQVWIFKSRSYTEFYRCSTIGFTEGILPVLGAGDTFEAFRIRGEIEFWGNSVAKIWSMAGGDYT